MVVSEAICRHQWAESVGKFSSEKTNVENSARQIVGPYNVFPKHEDNKAAWSPLTCDGTEYIELGYEIPVYITAIHIYETLNPGAVIKIQAYNSDHSAWKTLWSAKKPETIETTRIFSPKLTSRPFRSHQIRLELDCNSAWRQIDAVEVDGYNYYADTLWDPERRKITPRNQWVNEVVTFSSQLDTGSWSANQVIGPPTTYPLYGFQGGQWAQYYRDDNQYIQVKFEVPVHPLKFRAYENLNPGGIVKIEGFNEELHWFDLLWSGNMVNYKYCQIFEALLKVTNGKKYNQFRVWVDCSAYPSEWCEIDCMELIGTDELEDDPPSQD